MVTLKNRRPPSHLEKREEGWKCLLKKTSSGPVTMSPGDIEGINKTYGFLATH